MVVQKNWNNTETTASASESQTQNTATVSWSFQAPTKTLTVRPNTTCTMQTKQPITRQIAINTLAAMHRRFSLPGPVQPHSRPIAEFRASANKSLDMLRQTIQSAVTREIDQVIKKYLEKFFVPAVNNIRLNLGDESVSEDQVRAICRAMLDATRLLYTTPAKPAPSPSENSDDSNSADSKIKQTTSPSHTKRKEPESEFDACFKRRKIKQEETSDSGSSSPLPLSTYRDPEKWNPNRLTQETLFIMGSHAHKVLGLGNCRGRLYTRHAGLLRYPADSSDKEWIASHNLVNAVGGKTYIMVLEDIEELANSDAYRHNSLPMLGELTGFKVPPFMLRKIKAYVMKRALSGDISNPDSPQPSTSNDDPKFKSEVKLEPDQDTYDSFDASRYTDNTRDFADVPTNKDDTDLTDIKVEDIEDIKVDGIKVEDLDEMKVDGIKVEDLDVDIKVENIDDIDGINVEDMKLEKEDFALCKQDDDQNHLVDGLLESDIEFLSRNLGNIESDADARKTIEKLTGANPDTITLVGDEFDLGPTLNTSNYSSNQTKCITVASTTSGMIHSVPVAHIQAPRITGSTVHYYTSVPQRTVHHLPAVTIQGLPQSQVLRGSVYHRQYTITGSTVHYYTSVPQRTVHHLPAVTIQGLPQSQVLRGSVYHRQYTITGSTVHYYTSVPQRTVHHLPAVTIQGLPQSQVLRGSVYHRQYTITGSTVHYYTSVPQRTVHHLPAVTIQGLPQSQVLRGSVYHRQYTITGSTVHYYTSVPQRTVHHLPAVTIQGLPQSQVLRGSVYHRQYTITGSTVHYYTSVPQRTVHHLPAVTIQGLPQSQVLRGSVYHRQYTITGSTVHYYTSVPQRTVHHLPAVTIQGLPQSQVLRGSVYHRQYTITGSTVHYYTSVPQRTVHHLPAVTIQGLPQSQVLRGSVYHRQYTITGSTVHYYTSVPQRTVHHLPAVTIQGLPQSQVLRGIPINTKTGTFSTVMSQGTASAIIGFGTRTTNATPVQYVNVSSKSFPTGNILHNAIVSRNILNRTAVTSAMSFTVNTVKQAVQTTPKISTVVTASSGDFDNISTTKDMIDNACNSSVMLKKVLTLGSAGAAKSFMMHNTQKVLSTGFANGSTPPPNVTIVSSGSTILSNAIINPTSNITSPTSGTLSATHATLSALLASNAENAQGNKN
ncbi:mucin-5AC isoform X2 [Cydia pomonella]|uniref:mucin-5AC isoform X2 n=1 Tax=Cydia pomonella TaxID=82600 RepID=UPI002ADD96AD|nr:mucin-5AC isoform X2 [Cydia pomonella]